MVFRIIGPLIVLMLTGCAGGWSSPSDWFSRTLVISDNGLETINTSTPMHKKVLEKKLGGDYILLEGLRMMNGDVVEFYQGIRDRKAVLTILGDRLRRIQRIDSTDKKIHSAWGVKIGTEFNKLYSQAFGVCQRHRDSDRITLICRAPQSKHVSYLLQGEWNGPQELLPSDDVLAHWKVSQIIWQHKTD